MWKVSDEHVRLGLQLLSGTAWLITRVIFFFICLRCFALSIHLFPDSSLGALLATVVLSSLGCGLVQYLVEKFTHWGASAFQSLIQITPTKGRTEAQSKRVIFLGVAGDLLNKLEQQPSQWTGKDTEIWLRKCHKLTSRIFYGQRNRQRIEAILLAAKKEAEPEGLFYVEMIPHVLINNNLAPDITEELILDRYFLGFVQIVSFSTVLVLMKEYFFS